MKLSEVEFEREEISTKFDEANRFPTVGYLSRFGLSFLTTLNIYKDCFKGCQRLRKSEAKLCSCKL